MWGRRTIGTGSDELGVSRAQTTEKKSIFPLETSVDVFFRFSCTSPDQEDTIILLQPDVGMDDNDEATTSQQATARKEFAIARPTKDRQHQRMTEQNKQFDRGGSTVKSLLF